MKKSILPLLLLTSLCSQQAAKAQLKASIPDLKDAAWSLTNNNGVDIPIHPDTKGNFSINIKQLQKGFYDLADAGEIYLEPDYNLTLTKSGKSYSFTGKGSKENQLLQQMKAPLQQLKADNSYGTPMYIFLTEPARFIPVLDAYASNAEKLLKQSSNSFFKEIASQNIKFIKIDALVDYRIFYGLDSSRMDSLKHMLDVPIANRSKDYSQLLYKAYQYQFSKKLSKAEIKQLDSLMHLGWDKNNETLFKNSSTYRYILNNTIKFLAQSAAYKPLLDSLRDLNRVKLAVLQQEVSNPFIKDYFNYSYTYKLIKDSKKTAEIEDIYQLFLSNSSNKKYRTEVETAYNNLKATAKNAKAPDFSYINPSGKHISLQSMRGKYVYIDLWATWCAPCIAEIPDLKKAEEKYKDKNIVFVSISVDNPDQKTKWQEFVKENQMQGVQLMADKDFRSDFVKKFGVTSIPRFLLIGPDGKVIDNDAKRPSDPKLITQLDALLQ